MESKKTGVLVVVDMQNDFIDGALGTKEAVAIVPKVVEKVSNWQGKIYFTKDTHEENYLDTNEGKHLPVKHCIKGEMGWEICPQLLSYTGDNIIEKPTFGSEKLIESLKALDAKEGFSSATLVGLCTDICVISNALLIKAAFPEKDIYVDGTCCAGVTPESHENALNAMGMCQIEIQR